MKKMPPLPNRRQIPNNPDNSSSKEPSLQLVSKRVKMPQRYNSIERIVRESREKVEEDTN